MKKFIILVCAVLLLAGCAKKEEPEVVEPVPESHPQEPIMGGWEKAEDGTITDELKEIFDKATEKLLGVNYEPLELLETQLVAGMNYKFLAQATDVVPDAQPRKVEMVIYKDLEGNCSVTEVNDLVEEEPTLVGGWEAVENPEITEELQAIWDDANMHGYAEGVTTDNLLANLKPLELLGTQVVAGMNYKFLASEVDPNTQAESLKEVTIYKNLEGNSYILEIAEYIAEDTVA